MDKGKAIGAPEVAHVERALDDKWIRIAKLTAREKGLAQRLLNTTSLDGGEAESLALASSQKAMVLAHDKEARTMAGAMGIEHIGTAGVLLEAFVKGIIGYEELEKAVSQLSSVMWLSPGVVAEILRKAREVKR